MTEITRRFRVRDFVIDTWMLEGIIPECAWRNGRRYWSSNDINSLIAGCTIKLQSDPGNSIRPFARRISILEKLLKVISSKMALAAK